MKYKFTDIVDFTGKACEYFDGRKNYISTGCLHEDSICDAEIEVVDYRTKPSRANLLVEPGDILFAKMQSTKKTLLIDEDLSNNIYSTGFCSVKPRKGAITKKCLYYLITSDLFLDEKDKNCSGATQKAINNHGLSLIELTIPDFKEQYKIEKELDILSATLSRKKKQLAYLDNLIKARFVEMFENHEEVKLAAYIESLEAGKSLAGVEECANKVLKTGAVSYDYFDSTQVKNLPKDYRPLEPHKVLPGDIIVSRMNTIELVGAAAYVWNTPDNIYLPDRLWKAILKNNVNPIFVWQTIIQPKTKEYIRRIAGGTSGSMKNISKQKFLSIPAKVASMKEQESFADFVAQVDKSKFVLRNELAVGDFYVGLIYDSIAHGCINLRMTE